jgi:hypothetical protein
LITRWQSQLFLLPLFEEQLEQNNRRASQDQILQSGEREANLVLLGEKLSKVVQYDLRVPEKEFRLVFCFFVICEPHDLGQCRLTQSMIDEVIAIFTLPILTSSDLDVASLSGEHLQI